VALGTTVPVILNTYVHSLKRHSGLGLRATEVRASTLARSATAVLNSTSTHTKAMENLKVPVAITGKFVVQPWVTLTNLKRDRDAGGSRRHWHGSGSSHCQWHWQSVRVLAQRRWPLPVTTESSGIPVPGT